MKKPLIEYDIECLPNFFCICFVQHDSNLQFVIEISSRKDNRSDLKWITDRFTLVSYNGISYDNILTEMVLHDKKATNKSLYQLSQAIISREFNNPIIKAYKWKKSFDSIDIMTMLASSKLRVSLKHLQVKIKWPKVLDFEVDWTKELPEDKWDECIKYCFNDVKSLKAVVILKTKDLELRDKIQAKYGLDFRSMDGVKIAEAMLCQNIAKGLGIPYWEFMRSEHPRIQFVEIAPLINDFVRFETPKFQELLKYCQSKTIELKENKEDTEKQLTYRIVLDGVPFDFGLGGLHAWSNGEIIIPKDNELLIASDVSGYYPSQKVMLEYPHPYDPFFTEKYVQAYEDKKVGKATGDELMEKLNKLIGNSSFGLFLSFYSKLYAPDLGLKITMNGQLMLAMWIERLWIKLVPKGLRIVGGNTDAVEVICPKHLLPEYMEICDWWCNITRMSLDHDRFAAIYRKSCNHYIGIKANKKGDALKYDNGRFKLKLKGDFDEESDLLKGAKPTIIKMAITEHLVYNTSIKDFIENHPDIYDFCMSSRVGGDFITEHYGIVLQKTNRYYAAIGEGAARIFKCKKDTPSSRENILESSKVLLFNDYVKKEMIDYNINYQYYIREAQKIVDQINPRQLTLF
jgi:hypothetical protein